MMQHLQLPALLGTLLLNLHLTQAQSLLSALSKFSELSQFTTILTTNPALANTLLSVSASAPKTLLVPNNNAFLNYQASTGTAITSVAPSLFEQVLRYHTLNGSYAAESFSAEEGVTIPTLLTGPTYNNRSAGAALATASAGRKDGQVVFIAPDAGASTFTVRQLESDEAIVQSGLGQQVNLTATEGVWDGGLFHIVDGFLTLPLNCTTTIKAWGLNSLSASLQRTGLASVLDTINNVTCLGPNDAAFLSAGSPDSKLDTANLTKALLFHTIPQPLYSNFLQTGQTFTTASNDTVRVTLVDGNIYFNDAKLLQANVLTNNGLMHVIDRIMGALSDSPPPSTSSRTSSASATGTARPTTTVSSTTNATATRTAFTQVPTSAAAGNVLSGSTGLLAVVQFAGMVFLGGWV